MHRWQVRGHAAVQLPTSVYSLVLPLMDEQLVGQPMHVGDAVAVHVPERYESGVLSQEATQGWQSWLPAAGLNVVGGQAAQVKS